MVLCIQFVLVVLQIFWFMDDLSQRYDFEPWGRSFMASMIYLGLYACYEVYFHTFAGGQTPGKIFMKIEVARLSDGRPPVWWQSLARWPVAGVALPFAVCPRCPALAGALQAMGCGAVAASRGHCAHYPCPPVIA